MLSFNKVIKKVANLFSHKKSKTFVQVSSIEDIHLPSPIPSPNPSLISLTSLEALVQLGPASFPDTFTQLNIPSTTSGTDLFPLSLIPALVVPTESSLLVDPVVPEFAPQPRRGPEFAAPLAMGKDGRMKGLSDFGECQDAGKYAVQVKKMKYRGGRHFPPSPLSESCSSSQSSIKSTSSSSSSSRPSTASSTSTAPPPEPQPIYQTPTFCTTIPIILSLGTPPHSHLPVTKIYNVGEVIKSVQTRRDGVIVYC